MLRYRVLHRRDERRDATDPTGTSGDMEVLPTLAAREWIVGNRVHDWGIQKESLEEQKGKKEGGPKEEPWCDQTSIKRRKKTRAFFE